MIININKKTCIVHETKNGKWFVAEACTKELITNIPCNSKLEAIRRANSIINLIRLKNHFTK